MIRSTGIYDYLDNLPGKDSYLGYCFDNNKSYLGYGFSYAHEELGHHDSNCEPLISECYMNHNKYNASIEAQDFSRGKKSRRKQKTS